jgi:lipopolysaccharide assembly outer membrane protein LptD (OstA)
LRADHVQYNTKTYMATAHGNVKFDVDTQHLTADSADFNVQSGEGRFEHVRGEVTMEHPSQTQTCWFRRIRWSSKRRKCGGSTPRTYWIEHAWLTVCEPDKPSWKFFTSHATLHVDRTVAMLNANFRLFRIPLLYMPYASVPAGATCGNPDS